MSTVENPEGRNVKPLKIRSDTTHKSQQLTHRRRRVKKIHLSFMHGFMGPVTCVPGERTGCRALTPVTPGRCSFCRHRHARFIPGSKYIFFFLLEATKNPDSLFFF